jgi:hypothetical protein
VTPLIGTVFAQVVSVDPVTGGTIFGPAFPIIVSDRVTGGFVFSGPASLSECRPPFFISPGAPTPPLPEPCIERFLPGPQRGRPLGAYQIIESSANSNYHALQAEARKRYTHGFEFTAAYTFSHAIDDVSDLFPIAGAPVLAQNSLDLRAERADANFDVRHRFASSLVWDLPFGRGARGIAGRLLGGWQVASVFQFHTGQPFTLNLPFDANLDGNLSDRPSTADGLVFFNGHGPRRVALAPGRRPTDFATRTAVPVDPSGFITQFVFQDTSIARNTARGDRLFSLDLALVKRFGLTETQNLLFRTEVFNALNRANFGLPIRVIGAPGFGSAVDTATPARIIQFALKYDF